jgi:hypothetical protein
MHYDGRAMKLFSYRKPSMRRILGVSAAKSRFTRATGGRAVRHPKSIVQNAKRRMKRRLGYYSAPAKALRARHMWLGWFKLW